MTLDEVSEAVHIIEGLEPKPGRPYFSDENHIIVPDVFVFKNEGEWVVLLNEDGLPKVRISPYYKRMMANDTQDGDTTRATHKPFTIWGVNYDHNEQSQLIEDYWHDDWHQVVEDFGEIKTLGANVVRIHLQLAKFMTAPGKADARNIEKLKQLLVLAEETGLIVDIGKWTFTTAAAQIKDWNARLNLDRMLKVNVNVSKRQLIHP